MEASLLQMRTQIGFGRNLDLSRRVAVPKLLPSFGSDANQRCGTSMRLESGAGKSSLDANVSMSYSEVKPVESKVEPSNSISDSEPAADKLDVEQKKTAKIHDFCFGIPYGGFVFGFGLVGFLFTRNLAILRSGLLFGAALLALSTFSLRVWRQGKSSLPFILGQAALAAVLLGKHFQAYLLTKKLFPTGLYALFSAGMVCFYSYVLMSGGNPPPKKLKMSADAAT